MARTQINDLALIRIAVAVGVAFLMVQGYAHTSPGWIWRWLEEQLSPWSHLVTLTLVAFSVFALVYRAWLLGCVAILVGFATTLVSLLP